MERRNIRKHEWYNLDRLVMEHIQRNFARVRSDSSSKEFIILKDKNTNNSQFNGELLVNMTVNTVRINSRNTEARENQYGHTFFLAGTNNATLPETLWHKHNLLRR